jgi:hypothetical protein
MKVKIDGPKLYHKLQNALVYESDGFTKHLQLSYGNQTVKAISDRGTFHLEDENGTMRLFIPNDKMQRERSSMTELPKALGRYLLIDGSPQASKILLLVLNATTGVLDEILDDEGIVRIPDSDFAAFEQAEESEDSFWEGDGVV